MDTFFVSFANVTNWLLFWQTFIEAQTAQNPIRAVDLRGFSGKIFRQSAQSAFFLNL